MNYYLYWAFTPRILNDIQKLMNANQILDDKISQK